MCTLTSVFYCARIPRYICFQCNKCWGTLQHVDACLDVAGTSGSCTLWQRINVMQVMRALSFEAYIVHYFFCCFDLVQDAKLKVVQEMSSKFAAIVDNAARLASDPGEDDPLHSIASLYQTRANSGSFSCLPQILLQPHNYACSAQQLFELRVHLCII